MEQYPTDEEKIQNAIVNLRKRKVKLIDAAPSTPAKIGDSVFVNLQVWHYLPLFIYSDVNTDFTLKLKVQKPPMVR